MPDAAEPVWMTGRAAHVRRGRGLTRREGLLALAVLAPVALVSACTGSSEPSTPTTAGSAPPADIAAEVAAEESALVARYDAVLATASGLGAEENALLTLIRDQHAQHRDSLGGSASPSAPGSPSPEDAPAALSGLIAAEREAARSRLRACVAADDADLARLLTFIGASEASHVPALRDLGPAGA